MHSVKTMNAMSQDRVYIVPSLCYHPGMARSVDAHKPDCRCFACANRGRGSTVNFQVRIKPDMAEWIREKGGVDFVRELLQKAREEDP